MANDDRSSKLKDSEPPPVLTREEEALREASNTLRQYDRLVELIRGGIASGKLRIRPSTLTELNRIAVDGLIASPGAFRAKPVEILGSRHEPPPWTEVPELVDELFDYVNDNAAKPPIHLSAAPASRASFRRSSAWWTANFTTTASVAPTCLPSARAAS